MAAALIDGEVYPKQFLPERINKNDLPGDEFWLGGESVRNMTPDERKRLEGEGVKLYENPQKLIADIADQFIVSDVK